tara:strand:+ start:332 stop:1090 length:759 start_codon:yes stop_codon:yes gene_type:complete
MNEIDINCDVGEINQLYTNGVYGNLMDHVTSINIACGGHAGNKKLMRSMIQLAKRKNINIGAHPSYPDKINFGRKKLTIKNDDLLHSIIKQINKLKTIAEQEDAQLNHIKPHGALYNEAARDSNIATIIGKALLKTEPKLNLYFLAESPMVNLLKQMGIKIISESFADRTYEKDYTLRSRSLNNAVISNPKIAAEQAFLMIKKGQIKTFDGTCIKIKTDTICIHSDTPNAIKIAKHVNNRLKEIKKNEPRAN